MPTDTVRRVAVLGCGGSGKTWLSLRLGERFGLPVHHLDALFFVRDWTPVPAEEFERRQRELVAAESWVIDGNHARTVAIRLDVADSVVFLDRSTAACLWGLARRRMARRGPARPGIPGAERVTPRYVWSVVTFRRARRPSMLELLENRSGRLVVLRSGREMRAFLASPAAQGQPSA